MIRAMIRYMEKHLPHNEVFVLFWFFDRLIEQHFIRQFCQIIAHTLLNAVPVRANAFSIVKVRGGERFRGFNTAQFAEPYFIHAHQMDDLVSNRSM